MTVSSASLQRLPEHWAVASIGADSRARAAQIVNERLAKNALGHQITFAFAEEAGDDALLRRVALAYELSAIEGLDALTRASGGDQALRE